MFCPRCGTENEAGDRFCSSCGASLRSSPSAPSGRKSLRDRIGNLAGPNRQARIVTALTALALLVAVAAFIALEPADDDEEAIPRDAYTIEAEGICLAAKREIVAAQRRALDDPSRAGPGGFAAPLVPVVGRWRAEQAGIGVPPDRAEEVGELTLALRDVEIELAQLALVPEGARERAVARAREVDVATIRVEDAISGLGLEECARRRIGVQTSAGA